MPAVSRRMTRMRWIMFFILLYVMSAMEKAHFLGIPSGDRHWPVILYLPMLAVFYSLFAVETAAPLAALACGIVLDLLSGSGVLVGSSMIPLGLMSLLIVRARLVIFREHMLAQAVMTFVGLVLFAILATLFRKLIGSPALEGQSAWTHFGHLFVDAIYSAIAAPFLFWVFFRFPSMLGFTMQRHWGRR